MTTTTINDPFYARQAEHPLNPALLALDDGEAAFFKDQTGIVDDEALKQHVLAVQQKAFAVWPYPCIRAFGFTKLKISRYPAYEEMLKLGRERQGAILLDLGCCFGNDARKAVADGFPGKQVIASDLRGEFWTLGHELFRDSPKTCDIRFVQGDIFSSAFISPHETAFITSDDAADPIAACVAQGSLNPLQHRVSVLHTSAFFHLFAEAQQLEVAKRCNALLSMQPGSLMFGSHGGAATPGLRHQDRDAWAHTPETWKAMWQEAVPDGTLAVETILIPMEGPTRQEKHMREGRKGDEGRLVWAVRRI